MDLVRPASSRLAEWLELLLMADTNKLNAWNQVREVHAIEHDRTKNRSKLTLRKAKSMGM